jgi:hypothetical protein
MRSTQNEIRVIYIIINDNEHKYFTLETQSRKPIFKGFLVFIFDSYRVTMQTHGSLDHSTINTSKLLSTSSPLSQNAPFYSISMKI